MNKILKFFSIGLSLTLLPAITSCSKNNDEPGGGHHDWASDVIYFDKVPANLIGGPTAYGANLYYGSSDQITAGYMAPVGGAFIQFPVNYGLTFDQDFNSVWGYSFYNGGVAVSNWHNMEENSYLNQLSVYNESSPSGGNFLVATGVSSITDPKTAKYSDYSDCAHIYLTDAKGYTVSNPGVSGSYVSGEEPIYDETFFASVKVSNTTYTYLTMRDGNGYANALTKENKGWFKVQFIGFEDDDPDEAPTGFVEAYLANFDVNKGTEAGFSEKIREGWFDVDLHSIGLATILVVNFVGSDMGEYGLNTPAYCALDEIGVIYW